MTRSKKLAVLVLLALVAIPCTVALAKKTPPPPVDLHATTWVIKGTVTVNVTKVGKGTIKDQETLFFGTNGTEYLAANQFLLVSQATAETYRGIWSDPKQTGAAIFLMNAGVLEANLASNVLALYSAKGIENVYQVQATPINDSYSGTLVPGKTGTMTFSTSFTATVTFQGGTKQQVTGTFSGSGKATQVQ